MMDSASDRRRRMVEQQIEARGIRSPGLLAAMRRVRREGYVPSYLGEFAYEDTPLPIEREQTISQPYIVAFMIEALALEPGARVLEVGTGSGYAAAVLGEVAAQVYTIERHEQLAETAKRRLQLDGYDNVHVRHGDGTLGWPDEAPFDAIVVAAGGPEVPEALLAQLAIGGRLVIPVGSEVGLQKLLLVTRESEERYDEQELCDVRFVPLIGSEGWRADSPEPEPEPARAPGRLRREEPPAIVRLIGDCAEPFDPEHPDLDGVIERVGDARVVLIGEASHGTSEFYELRAAITRRLIEERGFRVVAAEADWPDAAHVDHYVRALDVPRKEWEAFARFPTWMWRNREVQRFVDWLHAHNAERAPERRVRFSGLDLYGLYNSIAAVLSFLEREEPAVAAVARERYGCLTPWQQDPAAYGKAALTGAYRSCERGVVSMLREMLERSLKALAEHDEPWFDAVQNARLVAHAEAYYRIMYYGSAESWNFRDRHMFETLERLLEFHGPESKAVVWAHNSHVGDARATEMSARGELNLGQLCRQAYGPGAHVIGFGTDRGSVAAASHWGGSMEIKRVRRSHPRSYEHLCHASGVEAFFLALRRPERAELLRALATPRLERAIGVIYRPETELASHYFHADLARQFDEYVWLDETSAITPLEARPLPGLPDTYPFGL